MAIEDEGGLEICLRLKVNGRRLYWMYIRIPGMTTALKDLSVWGSSMNIKSKHQHNLNRARLLPTNYNILRNRFRVVVGGDQLHGPFPAVSPFFKTVVSSAVVGSTVYCIGGDTDDFDIDFDFEGIVEERGGNLVDEYVPDPNEDYIPPPNAFIEKETINLDMVLSRILKHPPKVGDGLCHRVYTFNMDDPLSGWKQGNRLISPRLSPLFVSHLGKLYAFSGNLPSSLAFAEVYDPVSHSWTQLPPPPFARLPDTRMCVVPLKGWNKLWVFSKDCQPQINYTYDVVTQEWEKRKDSLDIFPLLTQQSHYRHLESALTPQGHMVVFWINQKDVVHAYDLSANQLFKGTISGVGDNHKEPHFQNPVRLHHLNLDLYCLISCDYPRDVSLIRSVLHVTVLKITFKPTTLYGNVPQKFRVTCPNFLKASVLACFAYPFEEYIHVTDSYLMSNKI